MYSVELDHEALPQIDALPAEVLPSFAEVIALLEIAPWSGDAYNRQRPHANMRTLTFGSPPAGFVVFLILEDQRRVVVLRVAWTD